MRSFASSNWSYELCDRIHGANSSNAGSRDQRGRAARGLRNVGSRVANSVTLASAVRNTWHHWLDLRRSAAGHPTPEEVIKSDDCLLEYRRITPIQAHLAQIIAELLANFLSTLEPDGAVNEPPTAKQSNSRNLFRSASLQTTTKVVQSNLLQILTGIGVVCCLIMSGLGSAPIEPARATTLEATTEADSRSSNKAILHQLQQSSTTAVETDLHINISANGSAVWTVQYHFQLGDPNETAAFDQLRTDIATNSTEYRNRFEQRMDQAVTAGENATDREMTISNVSVRAVRNGTTGLVTYNFVWQNFAATDGTRLDIGNSLAGLSLGDETKLTMSWPTNYEPVTVQPNPTERQANMVTWGGEIEFTESEPLVELARSSSTTNTTAAEAGSGSNGESSGRELPLPSIALIALVAVIGGLGVVWLIRRRHPDDTPLISSERAENSETDRGISAEEGTTPNGGAEEPTSSETDDQSLELLSNEEQVLEVLRRSGGRAKQQQVIAALGWTDAKTSSVVSRLRDDGTIEGFRLGRENVLRLPEEATHETTDDTRNDK